MGNIKSDLNTAGFTYRFSQLNTIDVHYDHCDIGYAHFKQVFSKSLLPCLVDAVDSTPLQPGAQNEWGQDVITHEWLWPRMSTFVNEYDTIVTETGTSYVGIWNVKLPNHVQVINQLLWSSIGYGVGAAQGAALAAKDGNSKGRTICFEGDGSFQLTAQEVATVIHHKLDLTMFVIENGGYTIERFIHGLEAHYNDVPQWQYHKLPEVLTPMNSTSRPKVWQISSRAELDKLLKDNSFASGKGPQFVEIHMPKLDAPKILRDFGDNVSKRAS